MSQTNIVKGLGWYSWSQILKLGFNIGIFGMKCTEKRDRLKLWSPIAGATVEILKKREIAAQMAHYYFYGN